MKFCVENNRQGGCYIEFQKGKFKDEHWIENNICLDDDIFEELKLYYLFIKVIPQFDHWGINEITKEQWLQIKNHAEKTGGDVAVVISEIDMWVNTVLPNENIITILGI